MKKTNKLVAGLALVAALFGCEKAQEENTRQPEQNAPAVATVAGNTATNTVATVEAPTNEVVQVVVPTNVVEKTTGDKKVFRGAISLTNETESAEKVTQPTAEPVITNTVEAVATPATNAVETVAAATTNAVETAKTIVDAIAEKATNTTETVAAPVTNAVETVTAATTNAVETAKTIVETITEKATNTTETVVAPVTNAVETVATTITNALEETIAPKNVFRGAVSMTNTAETVEKTAEPAVAPVITNTVNTVAAPTNAIETVTNVVKTATATTNAVETTTVVEQPAAPAMTKEQEILIAEVVPQIRPYVMKDGMTDEQLFELGAFMHLEQGTGTRDLAALYHKAAQNGMDLTLFEMAYTNRLKDQQDFMKACQEGIADARINNKDTFIMSGVTFNINSTNLVENLLTFKDAKDSGAYSVVIEGQPFKIFRTKEDMFKMINNQKRDLSPNEIVTPYGVYVRQPENVR